VNEVPQAALGFIDRAFGAAEDEVQQLRAVLQRCSARVRADDHGSGGIGVYCRRLSGDSLSSRLCGRTASTTPPDPRLTVTLVDRLGGALTSIADRRTLRSRAC
jgi:hypothetical protein